jgi:hypothetical protein
MLQRIQLARFVKRTGRNLLEPTMPRFAPYLAFLLSMAGFTGLCGPSLAGTLAGRGAGMGQVNQVSTGVGSVGESASGTGGLNVSVQPGAVFNPVSSNIAPANTSQNAINVQTNIDNSRTIDASSNIVVNDTVNGSNVTYGGNGASLSWPQENALGVINGMAQFNAGVSANSGPNLTAVTDALETATFLSQQQQQNN